MSKLLPKYKMEEAKKALQQAKLDKKRKINVRNVLVSFLIICEGTRTEPNYFESLVKNRYSDVCEVEIQGGARGTVSLIRETIRLRDKSGKDFDRVWAVFDKDDFEDFNDAIKLAQKNEIACAWSNESFELWYYLHFHYLDSAVSRSQYIDMIEREVIKRTPKEEYKYKKNDPSFFALLQTIGDEKLAIASSKKLMMLYSGTDYASYKPCTTVFQLVEELNNPNRVLDQINGK